MDLALKADVLLTEAPPRRVLSPAEWHAHRDLNFQGVFMGLSIYEDPTMTDADARILEPSMVP